MWPLIQANIPNDEYRAEFTGSLLTLMVEHDMDPHDIEDIAKLANGRERPKTESLSALRARRGAHDRLAQNT